MRGVLRKIGKWARKHAPFLLILIVLSLVIFRPLINGDLEGRDWFQLGRLCAEYGTGPLIFKFPVSFYLSQYGTIFASIEVLKELFVFNPLGYYVVNVFSRFLAALAIYMLVGGWGKRRLAGILAGTIFFVSYSGIESTTWATNYQIYIFGAMLLWTIYLWKKALEKPESGRMAISLIIASITMALGHTRIFAIPVILAIEAIYYFIIHKKAKSEWGLRARHIIAFGLVFAIFYFLTDFYQQIPAISSKINSVVNMLVFTLTGFPPVLHSFFLFWGNLIMPPDLVGEVVYPLAQRIRIDMQVAVLITTTLFSLGVFMFLYSKRNIRLCILSLIPLLYPLALFLSRQNLIGWSETWYVTAAIGGTALPIFVIMAFYFWKKNRAFSELIFLGVLISTLHLSIPWFMYHLPESNEASAFSFFNRYYTVPMIGVSIIVSVAIVLFLDKARILVKKRRPLPALFIITLIVATFVTFFFHGTLLNGGLAAAVRGANPTRHQELWQVLSPHFSSIEDKASRTVVYLEADTADFEIIASHFPLQLICRGFRIPGVVSPNVIFVSDRQEFVSLFGASQDGINFLALKVEGKNVTDITGEVLGK